MKRVLGGLVKLSGSFFLVRGNRSAGAEEGLETFLVLVSNLKRVLLLFQKTDYKLIRENCNMWRNYADIQDSWDSTYGIINHYGINKDGFSAFAGPGGWNDPDEVAF